MNRAAAFIDRDGVINALVEDPLSGNPESPLAPSDVVLLDGVPEALRRLLAAGFLLVGVSNQPAAAKGTVTRSELQAVQARVIELLAQGGVRFDAFHLCLHHPDGQDPELGVECSCRKPAPGMLLEAAHEMGIDLKASWIIGDTDSDILAGSAVGVRTILVEYPNSAHKRLGYAVPQIVATNLLAAVAALLDCVGS